MASVDPSSMMNIAMSRTVWSWMLRTACLIVRTPLKTGIRTSTCGPSTWGTEGCLSTRRTPIPFL